MTRKALEYAPDDGPDPIEAPFEDVSGIVRDKEDDEAAIAAEFDDDPNKLEYVVKVYRQPPNGGKNIFLFSCKVADLPVMERVRDEYGSGLYVARVYLNNRLKRTIPYAVETPKRREHPAAQTVNDPNVIQLLQELVRRPPPEAPRGPTVTEMLIAVGPIITALTPIVQGLLNRTAPDPMLQMQTMVATMVSLKELTDKPEGEEREKGWMDVVSDLIKSPMLTQMQQAANGTPQLTGPQPSAQQTMQEAQLAQLRQQLNMFIDQAKKSGDTAFWADYLEQVYPADFVAALKQPGAYEFLVQVHPPIGQFKPWFEAVLQDLRNPVNDDEFDPPEDAPPVPQSEPSPVQTSFDPGRDFGSADDLAGDDPQG